MNERKLQGEKGGTETKPNCYSEGSEMQTEFDQTLRAAWTRATASVANSHPQLI